MAKASSKLRVWDIHGDALIVAKSERAMRAIYLDYHGISIRGVPRRLIPPDEKIEMTDGDETWMIPASEIALTPGWIPAN